MPLFIDPRHPHVFATRLTDFPRPRNAHRRRPPRTRGLAVAVAAVAGTLTMSAGAPVNAAEGGRVFSSR